MTKDLNIDNVVTELKNFLQTSALSLSGFSRSIGVSVSALSQFKDGVYAGRVEPLAIKVQSFIKSYTPKREDEEVFLIKPLEYILLACSAMIKNGSFGIVVGSVGVGKTTMIAELSKKHPNLIVLQGSSLMTKTSLFNELAEFLNVNSNSTNYKKMKDIVKNLRNRDVAIVVDEAEYLPLNSLDLLRIIFDQTHKPLILVGTTILKNLEEFYLKDKKPQIFSRIECTHHYKSLSAKEAQEFFDVDNEVYKKLNGNMRNIKLFLKNLRLLGGSKDTPDLIQHALSLLPSARVQY